MTALMNAALGLNGLNLLLAAAIAVLYLRNFRQIRSSFTLALLLFGVSVIVYNAVMLTYSISAMLMLEPIFEGMLVVAGVTQLSALGSLSWAVLR